MRIAILEDTVKQAHSVARWLGRAGFESVIRHDGNSFVDLLEHESVDMLLLDWDVPGMCGIEVLKWARSRGSFRGVPIIMLTQHDDESSIVQGLDSGADDYLVKPARERELVARVRAQARKYYPESLDDKKITVGRYTLNADGRTALINGAEGPALVTLPEREFNLAKHLFRNVGCVVTKDELCRIIEVEPDRKFDASLATYISKLRSMLMLRSKNGVLISTVYNLGYRLEELPQAKRKVPSSSTATASVGSTIY